MPAAVPLVPMTNPTARRPWAATAAGLACAALLAACAPLGSGPAADATPPPATSGGPVRVGFADPATFAEVRDNPEPGSRRNAWLADLQQHLVREAARQLPPGQQLDVTITDVRRAGSYEPGRSVRMNDVRIVKDIYPPRIDLEFTLRAADGSVLRSGARALRDPMFLSRINRYSNDSLRFEKTLLDDWLASELRAAKAAGRDPAYWPG